MSSFWVEETNRLAEAVRAKVAARQAAVDADEAAAAAARTAAARALEAEGAASDARIGLSAREDGGEAAAKLAELQRQDRDLAAKAAGLEATLAKLRGGDVEDEARKLIAGLPASDLKMIAKVEADLAAVRDQRAAVARAIGILQQAAARLEFDGVCRLAPPVRERLYTALRAFGAALTAAETAFAAIEGPLNDHERLVASIDLLRDQLPGRPPGPLSTEAAELRRAWAKDFQPNAFMPCKLAKWREWATRIGVLEG
jgi:hypothetical protein